MMRAKLLPILILSSAGCFPLSTFAAQGYPERAIRLVVPYPPGGAADLIGRTLSQKMTEDLGQQVIVDNRAGGGQIIGTDIVAKAAPDGYTLLQASVTHGINPGLVPKLPYDSVKDFAPVSLIASSSLVLIVHPSLPVRSIQELIGLAKAKPGQLNYGSAGNGSGGHLATELFRSMTGVDVVHVPYKGAGPAMTDLIAGQVQLMFTSPLAAGPHVRAGKLRLLGVTGKARSAATPDVPTIAEAGVAGYEATLWYALLAPAGTPQATVSRLNAAMRKTLAFPDVRERFGKYGAETSASSPEEATAHIRQEIEKWRKVIKAAGIKRG